MRLAMRKAVIPALAAAAACCALAGCPTQSTYSATITPIYAATSGGGLFVYNGAGWTNYTKVGTGNGLASSTLTSVVVTGSGSGSRALVLAGGNAGVSQFNGTSWSQLALGLGSATVNRLFVESNVYAATGGGLSILNGDGATWTNDAAVGSANDVFTDGSSTLVTSSGGLYIYSGTSQVAGSPISAGSTGVAGSTALPPSVSTSRETSSWARTKDLRSNWRAVLPGRACFPSLPRSPSSSWTASV